MVRPDLSLVHTLFNSEHEALMGFQSGGVFDWL
jgi:hypothetical protein